MSDVVDRLGAVLLDASLAATAISGLVVLAMVQCRQPARRRGWARAGLLSTLALLPLAALNPVPRIDLRAPLHSLLRMGSDEPLPRPWPAGGPLVGPEMPAEMANADEDGRPGVGVCPPGGSWWPRRIARGLVIAYGAGVTIGLGWIFLGLWGSSRLIRRSWFPSEEASRAYESLPFEGRAARPWLLVSGRTSRPVLVGTLQPVILIPPDFDDPASADALRLSLLHELAHAEGLDHQFGPAATLAQAVWFFAPPIWWIRDQMKLDQEFLADRRAVAHFGTSGGYASSLVGLASSRAIGMDGGPNSSIGSPVVANSSVASTLFQRILMLLKCPFAIERQTPTWWRWTTAAILALTTLASSCLTLRGLAGWSDIASPPIAKTPQLFRLPQLVITQREHDDQPFDLRFRLPDKFNLTLDVMAEPDHLKTIEVLGHALGSEEDLDMTPKIYRLWHRINIRRTDGIEFVEVDGRRISSESKPIKLAPWLTIRCLPGQSVRIRDLELIW